MCVKSGLEDGGEDGRRNKSIKVTGDEDESSVVMVRDTDGDRRVVL